MEKIQGIYKITNIINNKIYIGSSTDIKKRWHGHKYDLRKNKHCNTHLQNAWNKYGEDNFKFEIIALIYDIEMILPIEQFYILETKCYIREIGYNKDIVVKDNYAFRPSDELIQLEKERKTNRNIKRNHGIVLSDEHKESLSKSFRGRNNKGEIVLTEKDVEEIMILFFNGLSVREVQKFYDVGNNALNKIKSGTTWKDIKNEIDFNSPLPSKLNEIINEIVPNRKKSEKLTYEQITEIEKELLLKEMTQKEIAKKLEVTIDQVKRIASSRYKNKGA